MAAILGATRSFLMAMPFLRAFTDHMLAFVNQQDFVMSTIIGATTMEQLAENIAAFEVQLSSDVIAEINKIQAVFPDPAP